MKKTHVILILGFALGLFSWKYFSKTTNNSLLIGKKVRARYTGTSGADLPKGAADMPAPLKNGEEILGTLRKEGLEVIQCGIVCLPSIIPNGQFEVIEEFHISLGDSTPSEPYLKEIPQDAKKFVYQNGHIVFV